jgi:protein-L-isoaspartate(D-aspartate) O-methyltransferase
MDSKQRIRHLQESLLNQYSKKFPKLPLSDKAKAAFFANPRHLFVKKYRPYQSKEWVTLTSENIEKHLDELYEDHPLILSGEYPEATRSSISQPTLVLYMMELMQIKEGQNILEIGSGSGWSSALMGSLVGRTGKITSFEIIKELVEPAQKIIRELGHTNVEIILGDGGQGSPKQNPFDAIVFTAAAEDISKNIYHQVKNGGHLLCVLKLKGSSDQMILFKKEEEHFEALFFTPCSFVPMTGFMEAQKSKLQQDKELELKKRLFNKAFGLKVYPADMDLGIEAHDFLIRKKESQFLWSVR